FLLVAGAVIFPIVVDVDKYRPQIVAIANEKINGKLEMGKLTLSLWGQILVRIYKLSLADAMGQKVVTVDDAYFHVPFSSVFTGSPLLTFKMDKPTITVTKNKAGQMNVMTLMKEGKTTAATTGAAAPGQPANGGTTASAGAAKPIELPGIVTNARLGVELKQARVSYTDQVTDTKAEINDFNARLKNISLSRPMSIEVWADLATTVGKTLRLEGPFRLDGEVKPELKGIDFDKLTASLKAVADDVVISMPGLFEKKKGVPANVVLSLSASKDWVKIDKFIAKFHNAEITTTGQVNNLQTTREADIKVASNEIQLSAWSPLIIPMQGFDLSGTASFSASTNGPVEKLAYQATAAVKELSAKAPMLKAKPVINVGLKVVTDKLEDFTLTFKAPKNDLTVKAQITSFTAPKMAVNVTSTGMDLDELVDFPPLGAGKGKETAKAATPTSGDAGGTATAGAPAGGKAPAADLDKMLDPIRTNTMLTKAVANVNVGLPLVKAYGVKVTNIQTKFTMANLIAAIDHFGMNVFGGAITAKMSVDLKPARPKYTLAANVKDFDLQQAVSSQLQLFKNTVIGKANFDMKGDGSSFNSDLATKNLNVKGNFSVKNATFASIDIGRMVTEAINNGLERVASKYPQAKGKSVKSLPSGSTEYDVIQSDFAIHDGKFTAPNFVAKSKDGKGIDLKGTTMAGLIDYALNARWSVIDMQNLTHARDISVNIAGTEVKSILAEGNNPVSFPVTVGCKLMAPCYDYKEVPEHFVTVAVRNVEGAAKARVNSEVKAKAQQVIQDATKNAPPAVKDALKKFKF
ncbi:MAG: AsmA-like C-terminal region-containing protein, partial [Bacteriovoracia bacterium]